MSASSDSTIASDSAAAAGGQAEGIRVWLEPGYDHGRTGAWMLDWPGCFAWGASRGDALARVPSAVTRHLGWLMRHGEPPEPPAPASDRQLVVEEVEPTWDGAYERNATFIPDHAPIAGAGLERATVHLGHARADLHTVMRAIRTFEAGGGRMPLEGRVDADAAEAAPGRTTAEVVRHLGAAEIWLASRLDRSSRFTGGPDPDADPDGYLAATRAWLVARLRELGARDAGDEAVDGKGETWTLRKVVRRLSYHSLDHLGELDRRLAIAERRVERLDVRREPPDIDALTDLLDGAGFRSRARDRDRLARSIGTGAESWTLWDTDRLVGFARVLTDGAWVGHISTVAIAPDWQSRGAGERLMRALLDGREDLSFVLGARDGVERFYERLGFAKVPWLMVRHRGR